jgi:hypothetical protein
MAISILERIAANVLSTINNVALPNVTTTAGNPQTLKAIRPLKKTTPSHLLAVLFQLSPELDNDSPLMTDQRWQLFTVVVYVLPSETDTTPIDSYNNDIAAALQLALMADYSRGGLAINTRMMPTIYFPPVDGEVCGIAFNFMVQYRTTLDNPYVGAI